jgi:hypothetical protein
MGLGINHMLGGINSNVAVENFAFKVTSGALNL